MWWIECVLLVHGRKTYGLHIATELHYLWHLQILWSEILAFVCYDRILKRHGKIRILPGPQKGVLALFMPNEGIYLESRLLDVAGKTSEYELL